MQIRIKRIVKDNLEQERVVLEVLEDCNIGQYFLFDTANDENGIESNKERHLYIFSSQLVKKNDFIVLYTRARQDGEKVSFNNKRHTVTYNFYRNLEKQIWNMNNSKIFLAHYDSWESVNIE